MEGDIRPPKRSETLGRTLLTYGSSITHDSNSLAAPSNWTAVLAHNLNVDLTNLGMVGSCCMEPAMAEYIAGQGEIGNWQTAVLELGINVLEWETSFFRERVVNIVRQIAGRNPDKKVFVLSPFCSIHDANQNPKPELWRTVIRQACEDLAFENVTYLNGLEILADLSLISGDGVHPNIYGVAQIGARMTQIMKKVC